ncbi:hypothetical protein AVDCRST_MAG92-966 [uncultured Coleofasciculus sp.]|uniref:Uncharacterized protein n=1 Tax=uncultured Coleofasciculus sp. TaxID=1267456 RepID=A0A6J4HNW0_9CYAN|nr:hypothetical protein AVDCRST_MAG92-966 [uncultured Coleofasciculus sp.]
MLLSKEKALQADRRIIYSVIVRQISKKLKICLRITNFAEVSA